MRWIEIQNKFQIALLYLTKPNPNSNFFFYYSTAYFAQ